MSWNYRVRRSRQRSQFPHLRKFDEVCYELVEVYYNRRGKPRAYSVHARTPNGSTVDELRHVLTDMLAATYKPVFDFKKERALLKNTPANRRMADLAFKAAWDSVAKERK